MDGTLMRTTLILRVACLEVAAVIAGKQHDGVAVKPLLLESAEDSSRGCVDISHAAVVIAQLARPTAGQRTEILRDEWIAELIGEFLGRNVIVGVVLMMRVEI